MTLKAQSGLPVSNAAARPVAMTIAGSDPGGGAGVQADLKTFAALRVYGFSALTAIVAQNSAEVARVDAVAAAMVAQQIEIVVAERPPDALKTGALVSAEIVAAVARALADLRLPAPVVDPVMVSSSGARLLDRAGERTLCERLIPLARVLTPNIPEAEALTGIEIDGEAALRRAARALRKMGARAVLIKGGHACATDGGASTRATDLLYDSRGFVEFTSARIAGGGAHGTGCALSAAIAAYLARGADLETAVRRAKQFVTRAMRHSFALGPRGRPLLDHFARQ
jgi:hydroxymethylpyrimidine kinase/phosphomethylpyrimidine kinase